MKITIREKLLSFLLALSLLLSTVPVTPAVAVEEDPALADTPALTETAAETPVVEQAQSPVSLLTADCQILRYVDEEVFSAGNHILRLTEDETLSSYAFLNADGTKTVYYLDEIVKFVDVDGTVQEKDLTLTAAPGGYTTAKNNIGLSIPTDPANGISLVYNGKSARLIPQGGTLVETVVEKNAVRYPDYYGEGTALVYTPTLSGVKEDIILNSYTGQTSFTFMLNTVGLSLYSAGGRYYLAEAKGSPDRIELGDVVTYDANGRFSVGTMTSETVIAGNLYRLTITVDEDFLTDPNTAYPVSVDPNLEVRAETNPASIEDTTVYQGKPTLNTGSWQYAHCGYYNAEYGIGRILVRLTGLLSDSTYQEMLSSQIQSAYFYITEATGVAAANIELYPFRGNSSWTESGATWNNSGQTRGDRVTYVSHGSNVEKGYDIKSLLIQWKDGGNSPSSGFVLCHANETAQTKGFYSSEFTTTANRPYVKVVYSVLEPMFYFTASQFDVDVYDDAQVGYYVFPAGQTVTWSVADESIATVDESGTVTGVSLGRTTLTATLSNGTTKSCYVYVTVADGVYYVRNAVSGYSITLPDSAANGTAAYIDNYRNSASTTRAFQLWKISYVTAGMYVIRPMSQTASILTVSSSGDVIVQDLSLGTEDSDVPIMNRWSIICDSSGYAFLHKGLSSATIRPAGSATTPKTKIIAAALSSAPDSRWTLSSAEPAMLHRISTTQAVTVATEIPIELGDTASLRDLDLELEYVKPPTTTVWTSSNSAVVQINQSTGEVRGLSRGKAVITVDMIIGNVRYTQSYTLIVRETIYVTNFYDSTLENDQELLGYIDDAVDFLNIVFFEEFYINFVMDGSPAKYAAAAVDACSTGSNGDCISTDNACGKSCPEHHKNIYRIAEELYENEWTKDHVVVMWSNSKENVFCFPNEYDFDYDGETDSYIHAARNFFGAVTTSRERTLRYPIVQIVSINSNSYLQSVPGDSPEKATMALLLAHEIAHTLELGEIYENVYGDDPELMHSDSNNETHSEPFLCIMKKFDKRYAVDFYTDIMSGDSAGLCDYCISKLEKYIPDNVYET